MKAAVVGGGITGLVAAYRLRQALGHHAEIVLFEQSDRLGGSLRTVDFAGGPLDIGAEAFVGRRPEVIALLDELSLSDQLVRPSGLRPLIFADGTLHKLPERTLMGIPSDAESVRGLVDDATIARIEAEPQRPLKWTAGGDVDVATLVADRFGDQVMQRSVDPLLGGVYAGLSATIGVRAALPMLAAALDAGASSLTAAVRAALPPPSTAPVFGGIRDGYRALLNALLTAANPTLRLGAAAEPVERALVQPKRESAPAPAHTREHRWSLMGDTFDIVVLATSAPVTACLLRDAAPDAAAAASMIPVASSALVAMALPEETPLPENSGILIATGEPLRAKAFTLSSRKWPHLAGRQVQVVRASFGRYGNDAPLQWSDADLINAAATDLAGILNEPIDPVDAVVQRWPSGLPQYQPGHQDRVAEIQADLADRPGLVVAGSYLQGVGVPACIASATTAVKQSLDSAFP